jgi:hypothetical protein
MQPEPPCTPSRRVVRHGVGASGKAVIDDGHGDFSPPTSRWLRYPPPSTSVSSREGHHAERPAHLHWQPAILQRCGEGGRRRADRRHLRALLAQYRSESRYLCPGGCAQRGGRGRVCTGSRPVRADHQMRSGVAGAQRRLEAGQRRIVQPGQGRLRRSGGRTSRCDNEPAPVVRAPAPSAELDGNDQACRTCYRGCGSSRIRVQVALGSAACISL